MFPRNTGTQLPDYAAPQRTISIFKILIYVLVEIVNVKLGSTCSSEILHGIPIRKTTKLNVDIIFLRHSFQYRDTH